MSSFDPIEYLKDYNNCYLTCSYLENEDEINKCINELKEDYKDNPHICERQEPNTCEITNTENFKNLLIFLIRFLKLLYFVRSKSGNDFDINIITSLGSLDLEKKFNLSAQQLKCIKLQDFVKVGMPSNLGDYFIVIKEIALLIKNGKFPDDCANNIILKDYGEFVSDFQPWSRLLVTCVSKYSLELLSVSIPEIEKIKQYGNFISDFTETDYNTIINIVNDSEKIILFVETKFSGGTFLKKSRKSRKSKKSRKYKKSRKSRKSRKSKRKN